MIPGRCGGLAVAPHAGIAARPKLLDCRCLADERPRGRAAIASVHQFILFHLDLQVILKYSIIGRSWGILYLVTMNSYQSSLMRRQWHRQSQQGRHKTYELPHVKTQQD